MKKFLFCIICIFYSSNAVADFSDLPNNEYKKQAKVYIDECIQKYYPDEYDTTTIFKPLFHDTKTISGLEKYNNCLKEKIIELFNISQIQTADPTYLSNTRSISILKSCLESIIEVEKGLGNNQPIDMIELDIKDIWEKLGTINGTTYEDELLDEMFNRFCLGK